MFKKQSKCAYDALQFAYEAPSAFRLRFVCNSAMPKGTRKLSNAPRATAVYTDCRYLSDVQKGWLIRDVVEECHRLQPTNFGYGPNTGQSLNIEELIFGVSLVLRWLSYPYVAGALELNAPWTDMDTTHHPGNQSRDTKKETEKQTRWDEWERLEVMEKKSNEKEKEKEQKKAEASEPRAEQVTAD